MRERIHRLLWNPAQDIYCDRRMDGTLSDVKAVSGFLPLLLPDLPAERRDALLRHLSDPETFDTAFPIPSVSVDDPAWSTDMWRGATWFNLDYLVREGLKRHGFEDAADSLEQAMLYYVNLYYERYGVLFEFYDAKDEVPPVACDRKGARREPYDLRSKMDSIRDYHWTAALTVDLLFDRWSDAIE
jgi:neutral trehalase